MLTLCFSTTVGDDGISASVVYLALGSETRHWTKAARRNLLPSSIQGDGRVPLTKKDAMDVHDWNCEGRVCI